MRVGPGVGTRFCLRRGCNTQRSIADSFLISILKYGVQFSLSESINDIHSLEVTQKSYSFQGLPSRWYQYQHFISHRVLVIHFWHNAFHIAYTFLPLRCNFLISYSRVWLPNGANFNVLALFVFS